MGPFRRLPLSLPATGALVWLGVYALVMRLVVVLWPLGRSVYPELQRVSWDAVEPLRGLAVWLSVVHVGWILFLLLHLLGARGRWRMRRHQLAGDLAAVVVLALALLSSVLMESVLPHRGDPGSYAEGVFNLTLDHASGLWQVLPGR